MKKFTFIDLFAGIGGFHQAAKNLGGKCVFASEIDPHAQQAYLKNYNIQPFGDITRINAVDIPSHDILFAGFPCQPFSIIGDMKGFNDARGTLFFDIARILEEKNPKAFILENVKQLNTHNNGNTISTIKETLSQIGYKVHCDVLNALDFGLPQKRERTIIVGFINHEAPFQFPAPTGIGNLNDILEPEETIDKKHFASQHIVNKRKKSHSSNHNPGIWHENKAGNVTSYPFSCALRAGASYNYLLVNGKRRLTPREMLRLQGFSDEFEIVCSDTQTRKQAGNAVPVNVISAVLQEVLNATTTSEGQ